MSIVSEIERIKTNIANAYTELENKEATMPTDKNSNNLADTIKTISSGGTDLSEYLSEQTAIYGSGYNAYPGIVRLIKKIDSTFIGEGPISNFNYAFSNLLNLEEIDFSNTDITQVDGFYYAFYGCKKLKSIDISNRTFPNATSFANMHTNNTALSEANFKNAYAPSAANYQGIFNGCTSLKKIDLSTFTQNNAATHDTMFNGCTKLQELSEIGAGGCMSIKNVLKNCTSLTTFGGFKDLGKKYTNKTTNYSSYTLDLSSCTQLTHDSLMNVINNLYDLNLTYNVANGGTLYTQSLQLGTTNKNKLTADEIAIATNKGWTVS